MGARISVAGGSGWCKIGMSCSDCNYARENFAKDTTAEKVHDG